MQEAIVESFSTVPFSYGHMRLRRWEIQGISFSYNSITYSKQGIYPTSQENDAVRFHLVLQGECHFFYKQLNRSFDLKPHQHNLMCSDEFDMVVRNKDFYCETFGIQVPRDVFLQIASSLDTTLFMKFIDKANLGNSGFILDTHWRNMNSKLQYIIYELIHCPYINELKKIFFLSKLMEILVVQADLYSDKDSASKRCVRTIRDKDKLYEVQAFLMMRLSSPPSLSEIAKTIGINEYQLKKGFKELFGTTVFGFIADQRLESAYQLLLHTDKTVFEVSVELGYATPQHFNNAFKKKFGITPKLVRTTPFYAIKAMKKY